jgi:hypothetical protein
MGSERQHGRMDPIAFFIARDVSHRALEGAGPPRRRTRRPALRSDRVRS